VESLEKVAFETNDSDHSSTMDLCKEHDLRKTILVCLLLLSIPHPLAKFALFVKVLHT
jgi:hypothetical protein